jgi:very-short-patch-repair endonuclease
MKPLARELRRSGTLAEVLLWRHLKGKQALGYAFVRQRPIDRYIVDFFCTELMLAVEIHGSSHDHKGAEDLERQSRLESLGMRFLLFEDREVHRNIPEVLLTIERWIEQHEAV